MVQREQVQVLLNREAVREQGQRPPDQEAEPQEQGEPDREAVQEQGRRPAGQEAGLRRDRELDLLPGQEAVQEADLHPGRIKNKKRRRNAVWQYTLDFP